MDAEHTPGPWAVSTMIHNDTRLIHSDGDKGWVVAVVWPMGEDSDESYPIRDANARLIAAAPDMLDALRLTARNIASILYLLPVNADATERLSLEAWKAQVDAAVERQRLDTWKERVDAVVAAVTAADHPTAD